MPRALEIAARRATSERCVSVVVIPGDVALKPAADAATPLPLGSRRPSRSSSPPTRRSNRLAISSQGAARDAALRSGCAGAHDELMRLAEASNRRSSAMRGKEHVEWDNPYDVA